MVAIPARPRAAWVCGSLALLLGQGLSGCSSDASPGSAASGGASAVAGAGGASAGTGTAGAPISAGAPGAGAANTVGGAGAGGSTPGQAGASNAGAAGSAGNGVAGAGSAGSAGSGNAGSAGSAGGNCAGNAVSLSANGTGSASDAAHARVEIDLQSDLPIGNTDRTVEFWAYIKPTDWLGEKNEVYVYGSPGSTNTAFGLDFGTNSVAGMPSNHATLNPYTNGNFTIDSTADLGVSSAAAQWLHVAMSWDGTTFKTYVNGDLKISKTNAGSMLATTSSALTMGCNPPINNCFNGLFDELRVWNVARSASDIKATFGKSLSGKEIGLVGYWKFDEAPGSTTAADAVTASGHAAHIGQLMADSSALRPTFVTAAPPAPLTCP
jgi:large repetitive protein